MFYVLYLRELAVGRSAFFVCMLGIRVGAGERERESASEGGRESDRQRDIGMIQYKRSDAPVCQSVTHAPQGCVMQGQLPATHSCLLLGQVTGAGASKFYFYLCLLTVKAARWSTSLSRIQYFPLKYLGANMNSVCSNSDFYFY